MVENAVQEIRHTWISVVRSDILTVGLEVKKTCGKEMEHEACCFP